MRFHRRWFLALGVAASFSAAASAADVTWDISAAAGVTGGAGSWNDSTAGTPLTNWTVNAGTSNIAWVNANNDVAIFGGTAGAVALTSPITAGGLTFNTTGYSVTGNTNTLTLGGTPTITTGTSITATISSLVTGSPALIKAGAGTLILTNTANSNNGNITISAGELQASIGTPAAGAMTTLGTGTLTANSGTTLRFKAGSTGNAYSYANSINLNSATLVGEDGVQTLSGAITLTGTNTINGVYAAKNLILSGTVSGSGSFNKIGPADLILSGDNTAFTGATTVSGGTLQLNYVAQDSSKLGDTAALTFAGNSTLALVGGSHGEVVGSTTINAGVSANITRPSGTATINLGAITANAGSYLYLPAVGIAKTSTANTNGILGAWARIATYDFAANDGAGNIVVATYTDVPFAGVIADDATSNIRLNGGTTGNITLGAASTTINTLVQNLTTATTIDTTASTLRLASGTVLSGAGKGLLTIGTAANAGTLTVGNAAATTGGTLEFSHASAIRVNSTIANNGTGVVGLLKLNGGELTLAGNNTYTGGTSISGGSVRILSTNTAFGSTTSNVTIAGSTLIATQSGSTAVTVANPVVLNSGATMSVDSGYASITFTNAISGAGNFLTTSSGTTILSGVNTYTGSTSIGANTLRISGAGQLNSGAYAGAIPIANTGILDYSSTANQTLSGVIGTANATGSLLKNGTGTLTLSNTNLFTGGTTVNTGILDLTGGGGTAGTIRGTVTVNTGATLRLSSGDVTGYATDATRLSTINLVGGTMHVNTVSNQTLGSAVINMTGGTITGIATSNIDFFQGASALNTLASATTSTISGTQLAMRQTGGVTFNVADGAAAIDLDIASVIVSKNTAVGDSLFKAGLGTMRLTAANTYTTGTVVNAGTLLVNNTTGSGTGTGAVTVNGTLGGTGALTGAVTVNSGGTLAPGASIESLATGAVTMTSGSTFLYELNTTSLNGDLLVTTGNLALGGATLTLSEITPGTVALNSKLTLINYTGTLSGTFNGYADDSTFTLGGNSWLINYNDTTGGSNFAAEQTGANFVTLTAVAAIPEPSTLVLGGLALLGFAGTQLRRRRQAKP